MTIKELLIGKILMLLFVCFVITEVALANVRLPKLFSDNMILQREMQVPVWICSGQLNMAMEVKSCLNARHKISSANYPQIRHFQVKRTKAAQPLNDVAPVTNDIGSWLNKWEVCDSSNVGHFTGAGYFFIPDLFTELQVPVGIISVSCGGTTAEAWTPKDTLAHDPELQLILNNWLDYNTDEAWLQKKYAKFLKEVKKAKRQGMEEPLYFNQPSVLFNGMIAPIIPYGIRGVSWYQGESNTYRAYQYRDLFPAMVRSWRKKREQGNFPFLFVQLANYHFEPQNLPELKEAQTMALSLPNTAMVVAIDIGNSIDIHPKNKQEVGRRLFLAAQKVAYGEQLLYSGPIYKNTMVEEGKCVLNFEYTGDGLISKKNENLKGFVIAGKKREFVEVKAKIIDCRVIVWSKEIIKPVAVRYTWENNPNGCNLYNLSGDDVCLSATPFRTDDWPGITVDRK